MKNMLQKIITTGILMLASVATVNLVIAAPLKVYPAVNQADTDPHTEDLIPLIEAIVAFEDAVVGLKPSEKDADALKKPSQI